MLWCIRTLDDASSIKSIALSGRNLSAMNLEAKLAADWMAESDISSWWCSSYFSLTPRSISTVSSTLGSSTLTGWNLSKPSIFNWYSVRALLSSRFGGKDPRLKMDRSRSSDRVRSSLAQQNRLESMPEVLEKEWRDLDNFLIKKKSREILFWVFWRCGASERTP